MIAKSTVITKVQSILPMIPPEEFPEIYAYLSSLPGIDDDQKPDDRAAEIEALRRPIAARSAIAALAAVSARAARAA